MDAQTFDREIRAAVDHHQSGRLGPAEEAYLRALALQPKYFPAAQNLGAIALQLGKYDVAVQRLQYAVQLDPGNADAEFNLALALLGVKNLDGAASACRRAIQLNPNFAQAFNTLGNCLRDMDRFDEALQVYQHAAAINPKLSSVQTCLGIALSDQGRIDESIAAHRRAVELEPQHAGAHWNLALVLLQSRIAQGWDEYEWRWKFDRFPSPRRNFSQPLWQGEPLNGRTILLHCEQGFGDSIQFVRYVPLVAAAGGRVILACPSSLHRLFECVPHIAQIKTNLEIAGVDFDLHCPLLSLPLMLGMRFDAIQSAPYLRSTPAMLEKWKQLLPPPDGRMRVGLCWAGGVSDRRRSIPLALLEGLRDSKNFQFFSLQKDASQGETSDRNLIDLTDQLTDFADTAALMKQLDLIITVDTAVAHLAGAIGMRVWLLTMAHADWRWFINRDDSPWYSTMRLFRQTRMNQWDDVVGRVAAALTDELQIDRWVIREMRAATEHHRTGRLSEAEQGYRRVLAKQPGCFHAIQNMGGLAQQAGKPAVAVQLFGHALQIDPFSPEAYANLAISLHALKRMEEAASACHRAIEFRPDSAGAYSTLGNCLRELDRLDEALVAHRIAVKLDPKRSLSHSNLGIVLSDLGYYDEAIAAHRQAILCNSQNGLAHWNLALNLLRQSNDQGWDEFEWRWIFNPIASQKRNLGKPQWQGEPLNGRTILLHVEQGLGDMIQFVRYVPRVAAAGGRVALECPPALERLFREVPGVSRVIGEGQPLGDFDLDCSLLSLPLLLGTRFESIPPAPYLEPQIELVKHWKNAVPPRDGQYRVGLVWAGSATHGLDRRRSMTLAQLAPLWKVPGVQFFSLQKGPAASQVAAFDLKLIDLTDQLTDLADTAAMMKNLDLIISVDTAPAHLAGAIGMPVWVLHSASADWRWYVDRDDSPWYGSMRLFRQTRLNQWDDVVERVAAALAERRS